jgi:hypothetical protein
VYCNTDPVIYVQNLSEPKRVKTSEYLGDITDELEVCGAGSYIEDFVSGGPKSMHFLSFAPPQ